MFEDEINYNIDDDDLGTFFSPVFSSTQGLFQKKSQNEAGDLQPANSEKIKVDLDFTNNQNNQRLLVKNPSFQTLSKLKDNTFCSPSKAVKRIFPGPAGLLPDRIERTKSITELISEEHLENAGEFLLCSQRTVSVFEDGPWKSMTEDFSIPNHEQLYEKFNINWIKQSSALKKQVASYNAPFLAAVIQSVTIDGDSKIPTVSVTLKDSTGVIEGTVIYSLYEENIAAFTVGSVLVLKQFGVLSMEDSYCVTITSNNLLRIYYSNVDKNRTMGNTQIIPNIKKRILQDSSVEEIWKRYRDNLVNIMKQQKKFSGKHHKSENSKPNLRKLVPIKCNNFVTPKNINQDSHETISISRYSNNSPDETEIVNPVVSSVKKFNFKKTKYSEKQNEPVGIRKQHINDNSSITEDDSVTISCSQISVKTDKEHTEIWKNLFEELDTDALFDDF